ncbi:alpha/beta hydrolase [Pleurocapsales cyanobacterium LEGE 06147]|nr:alpha/beta hydrolase [Pleurocapsales cyanobacterium LEGE 06147]
MNLFFRSLGHKISRLLCKASVVLLGALVIIPFQGKPVLAAEEIVFQYGIASHSVSIEDLKHFAATGEMSRSVRFLFDFTKQNPQIARRILVQEFPVETVIVSNLANSVPGEMVLSGVSQLIYPKSDRARIQALRGALIVSASDDNKVSLIELFRNYPTQQMYVDGKLLSKTAKDVNNMLEIFEESLKVSLSFLRDLYK